MVDKYQVVSPENIHISNIIQTEQVLVENADMHAIIMKEDMNLKESKEGQRGGLGGRKGKGDDIIELFLFI